MTDDLIARARKALEGVTEGPWEFDGGVVWRIAVRAVPDPRDETGQTPMPEYSQEKVCDTNPETAEFIAAARTLLPELVDALEAAQAENAFAHDGITVRPMTDVETNLMTQVLDLRREVAHWKAENERLQEEIGDRDEANEIIRNALKRLRTEKGVSE